MQKGHDFNEQTYNIHTSDMRRIPLFHGIALNNG